MSDKQNQHEETDMFSHERELIISKHKTAKHKNKIKQYEDKSYTYSVFPEN